MRISVVFVAVTVLAAPVPASAACMSIGEARHHFGPVHLYWHGSNRCWDASPGRRRDAATTRRQARGHGRPVVREPKWREARSELVADKQPAQTAQETAARPVAIPDTPPVRIMPVKLVSMLADWTERWVDVEQVGSDQLVKTHPPPFVAAAPEQRAGLVLLVRGLALFAFCFGLLLTFVTLLMRSAATPTGPPSLNGASRATGDFVAADADDGSHALRTDRNDFRAGQQGSTAQPAALSSGAHWLRTVGHFVFVLISRQASFVCWRALRWGRHIGGFISDGAYPTEVKWPPHSAGAMISKDDAARPFTLPSRLLEETRQAASRAVSPGTLPAHTRSS